MGLFVYNMGNQDKQLYKRVLQLLKNTQIDDNYFLQKISATMEAFCKVDVWERKKIRNELRDFLLVLENKNNTNSLADHDSEKEVKDKFPLTPHQESLLEGFVGFRAINPR